jgi:tetratricopeptide (TPR) repeat protein
MKKLTHKDQHYLDAAEGWLGLGDHLSAKEELERISPELLAHPKVLAVRLEACWKAKDWEVCVELGEAVVKSSPKNSSGWIGRSFALHELKRTREAYDRLLPAKGKFPKNATIPYNLACYCAQLNRLEEAQVWLRKAMAIDEQTVRSEAIEDPDLKPLWDSMSGTMWKRE